MSLRLRFLERFQLQLFERKDVKNTFSETPYALASEPLSYFADTIKIA